MEPPKLQPLPQTQLPRQHKLLHASINECDEGV